MRRRQEGKRRARQDDTIDVMKYTRMMQTDSRGPNTIPMSGNAIPQILRMLRQVIRCAGPSNPSLMMTVMHTDLNMSPAASSNPRPSSKPPTPSHPSPVIQCPGQVNYTHTPCLLNHHPLPSNQTQMAQY